MSGYKNMNTSQLLINLIWTAKFWAAIREQKHTNKNQEYILTLGDNTEGDNVYMYSHRAAKRCESCISQILTGCASPWQAKHLGMNSISKFIWRN